MIGASSLTPPSPDGFVLLKISPQLPIGIHPPSHPHEFLYIRVSNEKPFMDANNFPQLAD